MHLRQNSAKPNFVCPQTVMGKGTMRYEKDMLSKIWMIFLFLLLIGFLIWGIFYVENLQAKISILGIVAIIVAAFTSVLTVSINNRKAKEREYELHILEEKQKVFEHFYNSYFEILFNNK